MYRFLAVLWRSPDHITANLVILTLPLAIFTKKRSMIESVSYPILFTFIIIHVGLRTSNVKETFECFEITSSITFLGNGNPIM